MLLSAFVLPLIVASQGKDLILQRPRPTVTVTSMECKCGSVNGGPTSYMSGSVGGVSGSGTYAPSVPLDSFGFGTGLTEMMLTALSESKGFVVVEPPAAPGLPSQEPSSPATLKPQFIIRGAITELACRGRSRSIGYSGADANQSEMDHRVVIDVRLIEPDTGIVLESIQAVGKKRTKDQLISGAKAGFHIDFDSFESSPLGETARLAMNDAVQQLIKRSDKYPWGAYVAAVENGEVYLNVGNEAGLKVGDLLEVLELGKPISDPANGRIIGRTRPKVLGQVEIVSIEGTSCIGKPKEGTTVAIGHYVRFLKRPGSVGGTLR